MYKCINKNKKIKIKISRFAIFLLKGEWVSSLFFHPFQNGSICN